MLFIFLNLSPPWAASAARASSIGVLFAVIVTAAEAALAVVVPAVVEAAGLTAAGSWAIAALVINERVRTRKYFFISNPPQIKVQSPRSKTKPQVQRDAPIAGIRAAQTAAAKSAEAAAKASRHAATTAPGTAAFTTTAAGDHWTARAGPTWATLRCARGVWSSFL